jgi:hypothetical protein
MGNALEVVTGFTTAAGAAFTAVTLASGNSLVVRNCPFDSRVLLLSMWSDFQVAVPSGIVQLRSPKLHDNVRGLRYRIVPTEVQPLLPRRFPQPLVPQDTLILEHQGSAVGGDIETTCLLVWYENLPGTDARFLDADSLMKRGIDTVTVETSHAFGAAGGYSGEVAITSGSDLLKANTDYALVGYVCSGEAAAFGWRGADSGNMRVAGPGSDTDRHLTRDWFRGMSQDFNLPLIPIFNSANKGGILVDGVQDENAGTVILSSIFVELAPEGSR